MLSMIIMCWVKLCCCLSFSQSYIKEPFRVRREALRLSFREVEGVCESLMLLAFNTGLSRSVKSQGKLDFFTKVSETSENLTGN